VKTMIARGCTGVQDRPRSAGKKSVDSSKRLALHFRSSLPDRMDLPTPSRLLSRDYPQGVLRSPHPRSRLQPGRANQWRFLSLHLRLSAVSPFRWKRLADF
jgi:hypothetical protein